VPPGFMPSLWRGDRRPLPVFLCPRFDCIYFPNFCADPKYRQPLTGGSIQYQEKNQNHPKKYCYIGHRPNSLRNSLIVFGLSSIHFSANSFDSFFVLLSFEVASHAGTISAIWAAILFLSFALRPFILFPLIAITIQIINWPATFVISDSLHFHPREPTSSDVHTVILFTIPFH